MERKVAFFGGEEVAAAEPLDNVTFTICLESHFNTNSQGDHILGGC